MPACLESLPVSKNDTGFADSGAFLIFSWFASYIRFSSTTASYLLESSCLATINVTLNVCDTLCPWRHSRAPESVWVQANLAAPPVQKEGRGCWGVMAPAALISAGQPPEIQFAQRLASNEKRIRDRALKKLRGYITLRTQSLEGKVGEARGTKYRVRPAVRTKIHVFVIDKHGKDHLQSDRSKRCIKMVFIWINKRRACYILTANMTNGYLYDCTIIHSSLLIVYFWANGHLYDCT